MVPGEYKLERMKSLALASGNLQDKIKSFHLSGSKGKGTTALFLSRGLEALGNKTGLYTSPHVRYWAERITREGKFWEEEAYRRALTQAITTAETLPENPHEGMATVFEILTQAAFYLFTNEQCDWMVLEAGLGGRLDATNIVTPQTSVLTLIELEHTEILGKTLEKIAGEKAGIIKHGVPVWTYEQNEKVLEVFKKRALEKSAPFFILEREWRVGLKPVTDGIQVEMAKDHVDLKWIQKTLGLGIARNSALAVAVLQKHFSLNDSRVMEPLVHSISEASLPGRMEVAGENPTLILDGAHTLESIRQLTETVMVRWPNSVVVYGSSSDKNIDEIARYLRKSFSRVFYTSFHHPRSAGRERLADLFPCPSVGFDDPNLALKSAKNFCTKDQAVVVTGSLIMLGELSNEVRD